MVVLNSSLMFVGNVNYSPTNPLPYSLLTRTLSLMLRQTYIDITMKATVKEHNLTKRERHASVKYDFFICSIWLTQIWSHK